MPNEEEDFLNELPLGGEEQDETTESDLPSFVGEEAVADESAEETATEAQTTQTTDEETPEETASPEPPAAEAAEEPSKALEERPADAEELETASEEVASAGDEAPSADPSSDVPPLGDSEEPPAHGDLVGVVPELPKVLGTGENVDQAVQQQWDRMMAELSQNTRMRVWESGISSMQELLSKSRSDLEPPRGGFKAGMIDEIENWTTSNVGYRLPKTRRESAAAYVPPSVPAGKISSRKMTPEMAAARKARLNAIRGDSRKR